MKKDVERNRKSAHDSIKSLKRDFKNFKAEMMQSAALHFIFLTELKNSFREMKDFLTKITNFGIRVCHVGWKIVNNMSMKSFY